MKDWADVVAFAGLTGDYSELHTSEEFASRTDFGQRVAHGMLGLAYAHGLMWARTGELRDCAIAFLGISDWRFRGPLLLGDTIHVRYTIAELRESASRPGQGIATYDVEVRTQRGDVAQDGRKAMLLSTTPLAAARPQEPAGD